VGPEEIRKAASVAKVSAVEVEFSLFSTDILRNGFASTCCELHIPVVAYSPMSRGFLTGDLKKPDDISEDDMRRYFPRFQGEACYENFKLAREVKRVANEKGVTSGQVAIAWVRVHSGKQGILHIIPIPEATTEARVIENTCHVSLTDQEVAEIDSLLNNFSIIRGRYSGA